MGRGMNLWWLETTGEEIFPGGGRGEGEGEQILPVGVQKNLNFPSANLKVCILFRSTLTSPPTHTGTQIHKHHHHTQFTCKSLRNLIAVTDTLL